MSKKKSTGLFRVFLQFSAFLAALLGLNYYMYVSTHNKFSFVVMIACAVIFVGWIAAYFLYFRKIE